MKGIKLALLLMVTVIMTAGTVSVCADSSEKIKDGVSIDSVDVSGMTRSEAKKEVKKLAKEKADIKVKITLNKDTVETTLGELGYKWTNKEILDEAVSTGKSGNVIKRYENDLTLKNEGITYNIKLEASKEDLQKNLKVVCKSANIEAKNASLKFKSGAFKIIKEKEGCVVDYEKSGSDLYAYLTEKWDKKSEVDFTATTKISKPKYTTADCEKVSDTAMGSYTTYFTTGGINSLRNLNIKNGVEKLNGFTIYPGEEFSCNEHLIPWTEDNGWQLAGTYVNGKVEDSLGGGICQVSTTLYNALLEAEIKVVKRFSHSMAVGYVPLAADAALAGDYKDLVFKNDTADPIYVRGIYDEGGSLTFKIYGHDTRKKSHSVKYVSETVKTIPIETKTVKDSSKPVGYSETEGSGHVGYVAKLYKITYENGKQVKKELLHTSTYAMAPVTIVKGTASAKKEETTTKKEETTTKKSEDKKNNDSDDDSSSKKKKSE